jgi:hypothetical protein
MHVRKSLCLGVLVALLAVGGVTAQAHHYSSRQYYTSWRNSPHGSYYYRYYYFKPSSNYEGYRHHYAIYYPSHPHYIYFYNPYRHVYWGRCLVKPDGKNQYSLLAEKDRKENLCDIPESAFPAPSAMPPIPESTDEVSMELPPDDLPTDETLPK